MHGYHNRYTTNMLLILHIVVAIASLLYTTYLYFAPSHRKLPAAYGLVGLTIASGTVLVVSSHSALLQACMTGLVYLGAVSLGLVAVHARLAKMPTNTD